MADRLLDAVYDADKTVFHHVKVPILVTFKSYSCRDRVRHRVAMVPAPKI